VVVAVLDSGVDRRHELLRGRLARGLDLVEDDRGPWEEANGVDDDGDGRIDEGFGHGTFVAGLVLGVAPGARVLPIRVLDDEGNGDGFDLSDGIYHAVRHRADVISLSLGLSGASPVVSAAVDYAERRGVVVVCAAVTDPVTGSLHPPGAIPSVLSVTALDLLDRRPPWAAAHRRIDLAAPGVGIVGPWPGGKGRTYAKGYGTSFATALAAGAAALVIDAWPDLDPAGVRGRLADAARDVAELNPGDDGRLGAGRLDLAEVFR
jgi:subtilisin family serine protease